MICGTKEDTIQCVRCPRSVCPRHAVKVLSEVLCPRCARLELDEFKDG